MVSGFSILTDISNQPTHDFQSWALNLANQVNNLVIHQKNSYAFRRKKERNALKLQRSVEVEHSGFEPLTPTLPVGLLQSHHPFTTAANAGIARVCERRTFLSFTSKTAVLGPVLWSENWSTLHWKKKYCGWACFNSLAISNFHATIKQLLHDSHTTSIQLHINFLTTLRENLWRQRNTALIVLFHQIKWKWHCWKRHGVVAWGATLFAVNCRV